MENKEQVCVFCKQNQNEVPLVQLAYMQGQYWICPQHIPVLIHDPAKLAGMLPGAENMKAG
ncbi:MULTISPECIES: hypothetical protein [unclassified Lentimicrobium]|uniref:hypothetical protein n=1 Tax=unclassified Lentimicrobium TaxID=2677434 RepID=UPI001553CA60|nr:MULTISPECIES: hypothetical protein [unclassified Lentimicrobium]NPD46711.1 hypothetical protein [Lentimicrobium sp. S6]NPD85513.1 hypothetical protein [Lentimicrobium sp. L6]